MDDRTMRAGFFMGPPQRRPLTVGTLGFALGIFLQFFAGYRFCVGLPGLAALAAAAAVFVPGSRGKRRRSPPVSEAGLLLRSALMLILAACCCGSLLMYMEMGRTGADTVEGLTAEEKQAVRLSGEIESVRPYERRGEGGDNALEADYCKVTLRTGFREKALVSVRGTPEQLGVSSFADLVGRRAEAFGSLSLPPGRRNPGCFDYRSYLRSRDVFFLLDAGQGGLKADRRVSSPFFHQLALMREAFAQRVLEGGDGETGGLLLSMLFGDKSYLDETVYEEFQQNGTAHLLAVSGIHVNVIYLYMRKLMGSRRDLVPSAAVLAFLAVYAALSGFAPSAVRASLMIAMSASAVLLRRDYDMCTAVSASALLLLVLQPYRLFDAGFQLSFLAAGTLAVILPWAEAKTLGMADRLRCKWIGRLFDAAGPLAVLQITMAPATAYLFQYFSWSSFLLNPLLIPLAGVVVPLGMLAFPVSFLPKLLSGMLPVSLLGSFPEQAGQGIFALCLNGAMLPARIMILTGRIFAERDWGFFRTVSPPMGVMMLFYGGIFFACCESRYLFMRRGGRRIAWGVLAGILTFSSVFPWAAGAADLPLPFSRRTYPMVFVDVGQGDCLHIRTPGGRNVLVDGGGSRNYNIGKKTLAPYLLKNGVKKIDLALATHLHADHYRGIEELAAIMPVEKIGLYEGNRLREEEIRAGLQRESGKRETEMLYLKKGDRIRLDQDVWVEVLAPERKSETEYRRLIADDADENASCLIFRIHWKKLTVLMTGDMGFEGETDLLAQGGGAGAHILKTGHHGSRYSTSEEFLKAVSPNAAVIQVGKNNFGHPSGRVLELFRDYDIITYRTDQDGAIFVRNISENEAVLSDICEEKLWRISLQKRRSTRIRPFRRT